MTIPTAAPLDRSIPPGPGRFRPFDFPAVERGALSNGVRLLVAPMRHLPVVTMSAIFDAGGGREDEDRAGIATMTAELLDAGTSRRSGAQIAEDAEGLGADLEISASWDAANAGVTALRNRLEPATELLADLLFDPRFPLDEVERLRQERLADVLQRRSSPRGLASEMALRFIYDSQSPFSRPLSGTPGSINSVSQADLQAFHAAHYVAGAASIIFAGDVGFDEARGLAESCLAAWAGPGSPAGPRLPVEPRHATRHLALVDRPGSVQAEIRVGHVGVERGVADYSAISVMNSILGGAFTSRLNLNLRERHGFTYGVSSGFSMRRGAGPFIISTAVETAVTAAALREILVEVDALRAEPVSDAELVDARNYLAGAFPLRLQTTHGVAGRLLDLVVHDLPDDYFDTYRERILAVTAQEVLDAARARVRPDRMMLLVVGDAASLHGPLRDLGLGDVHLYDSNGERKE
jgi:zinc protease